MIIFFQNQKRQCEGRGKRGLPGLRAWAWRHRWVLFVVLLLTFPLHILYLIPLARGGFGWLPLACTAGLLLFLLVVGARRQFRQHVPTPPDSREHSEPAHEVTLLSEVRAA